jgi:hypothetical protein
VPGTGGGRWSRVREGRALGSRVLDGHDLLERLARSRLLGVLLRPPHADARFLAVDDRRARELALVRRPLDLEHRVRDVPALPRERLLQLRLVVDVMRRRVVDPAREGGDDRSFDRLEPVLEEEGRERRLEQRGEDVLVPDEPVELLVGQRPAPRCEPRREVELAGDRGAALPRDDVRADLREPALGELRVAEIQLAGDRELEDAVAEELEPLVRRGAIGRPGRVGEDVLEPLLRERLDQALEWRWPLAVSTGAS